MDKYVYIIGNNVYFNLTNRCSNECVFCHRWTDPAAHGHNLIIDREPSIQRLIQDTEALGNLGKFEEFVFCGYGEPTIRLDAIKEVAKWLKKDGRRTRVNTNGQGSLLAGRDIMPELIGLIDAFSISLNFHSRDLYNKYCKPDSERAWDCMLDFARKAKAASFVVTLSAIVDYPDVDILKCRKIAEEMGVGFREKPYFPPRQ